MRAWLGMETIQPVTAEEVWFAWRRFKVAFDGAKMGGPTDGLLELREDFDRVLAGWLNGPAS